MTDLTVVTDENVKVLARPEAPIELTDEQLEVWHIIADSKPGNWFDDGNIALLVQHCRHITRARRIAQAIDSLEKQTDDFDMSDYRALLKDEEIQTRAIAQGATKMRLTQQSRYTAKSAGTGAKKNQRSGKPWERN